MSFTERVLLLGVLLGAGVRARIYLDSPLRPDQPAPWALAGAVQDVAVLALAGALALLSTRWVWQRRSRTALGTLVVAVCVLHLVWSEIVVYFGHGLRARDLQIGLRPTFLLRSMRIDVVVTTLIVVAVAWSLLHWTSMRSRSATRAWATPARLLALGFAACLVARALPPVHQAETGRNPIFAVAALVREWPATDREGRVVVPSPVLRETSVRDLAPRGRDFSSDEYPLAYRPAPRSAEAPWLPAGLRPNVVFIVMEGLRSEEMGSYGGKVAGLTPNLDALARDGIRVDRFYSNGNHTPEGELAIWYGLLPSPYEVTLSTRPDVPMTGLPELLRESGWKSFLWIHNGDQAFYERERFYLPRGFRMIDGRDYPPSEPRTNWGFSDRTLARHAVEALGATVEPFAAMVLTVSNHHPFQLPSDARTRLEGLPPERRGFLPFGTAGLLVGAHTVPMLKTIHYTDEAIGDFFALARKQPWFSRTVFVISGDHGLAIAPLEGPMTFHRLIELRHRVPLIIYSPLLAGGKVIDGPASQVDILPTIAGLLGLPGERAGIGRDLLDPDADPQRQAVLWTREARTISLVTPDRAYHRRLASGNSMRFDPAPEELLVDPATDADGHSDLMGSDPAEARRLSHAALEYFDVYPWLVVQGRSGVPPAGLAKRGRAARDAPVR